jgi:hypothetical protein
VRVRVLREGWQAMNISLSFKKEFAPLVESGKKRQTIRMRSTRQAYPYDILHLFTGMRTKQCRKLSDVKCLMTADIEIDTRRHLIISNEGQVFAQKFSLEIARLDGFNDLSSFFQFFREQYGEGIHKMRLYRW